MAGEEHHQVAGVEVDEDDTRLERIIETQVAWIDLHSGIKSLAEIPSSPHSLLVHCFLATPNLPSWPGYVFWDKAY